MPNKGGHRRFGNIRKLPSGRYQARYPGPDGRMRTAPQTFARKGDAERYLVLVEAQMARGEWTDPERAKVELDVYAESWITQRPNLRPRTVELYRWLLRKHIAPGLGSVPLGKLTTDLIREWRVTLLDAGVSSSVAAKAYRLLRAVLWTAVKEDEILHKNPCRIPGADQEKPAERPVLTLAEVFALADLMPERQRAMVLLATFASLRYGEVTALERRDVDLDGGTVCIRQAYVEQQRGGLLLGPPKSRAGRRVVAIPAGIVPTLRRHLADYVDDDPAALVFTGPKGAPIKRSNFNRLADWPEAVAKINRPGLHFHDLRHTGNTLAARAGVSTRDLMARMGHDSMAAAIVYQHASSEADRAIAAALNVGLKAQRKSTRKQSKKRGRKRARQRADGPDDGAADALAQRANGTPMAREAE
jgi:integrase